MPSVAACIFLKNQTELEQLFADNGRDLTLIVDNMIFYICLLDESQNMHIFQQNGQINTNSTIYVRRILVPYLNKATEVTTQLLAPPNIPFLVEKEIPIWTMEIETFIGITNEYSQSLRLRSCNIKIFNNYADFRTNGSV